MKITKKDCQNMQKINIENYLMKKKKHKKRIYMEKISIKICREKTKKE